MRRLLVTMLVVGVGLSACAMAPPDPLWQAVMPANPFDLSTPESLAISGSATAEQSGATRRAYSHIVAWLPAPANEFLDSLRQEGFTCNTGGGRRTHWRCIYSRTRPPAQWFTPIRVTVVLDLPYGVDEPSAPVRATDIEVVALAVPDRSR